MAEAAGLRVHVYTSPHLVRFNERIRVAGSLVPDDKLIAAMERIERINDGAPITVFEVITATAFDLFADTPADLCVLEVGLGGRGDATNVIDPPAACAITSISLDHRELLGPSVDVIAREKAGIMKPGIPVAIGVQPDDVRRVLLDHAAALGAPVKLRGRDWDIAPTSTGFRYTDASGAVDAPIPVAPRAVPAGQCRHRDYRVARHSPATRSSWASSRRVARQAATAARASSANCCRPIGSFGWTAATIPVRASSWPSTSRAGPTDRCIW